METACNVTTAEKNPARSAAVQLFVFACDFSPQWADCSVASCYVTRTVRGKKNETILNFNFSLIYVNLKLKKINACLTTITSVSGDYIGHSNKEVLL